MPATPDDLFRRLAALAITSKTHHHPPLRTVEESKRLRGALAGGHVKNLYLRDHKKRNWLVVLQEDRAVDLKALATAIGAGRLSFGRPERLMQYLGVAPGAVTPFAVINDPAGEVRLVLERPLLALSPLNLHPLDNTMTTQIGPDELMRFLQACGHEPLIIDL